MNNVESTSKFQRFTVAGADAVDFLHRLTSQDIKTMAVGGARGAAALEPTSFIIAYFLITKQTDGFEITAPAPHGQKAAEFFEKFHFAEDIKISPVVEADAPTSGKAAVLGLFPKIKWGVDFSEKNLVLEAPLSEFVSRNKGCYPGQEVVERVFTYGNVAKKIVGLKCSQKLAPGLPLFAHDGKPAGQTSSATLIDWGGGVSTQGIATVKRPYFEPGMKLHAGNASGPEVEVVFLPGSFEIKKGTEQANP